MESDPNPIPKIEIVKCPSFVRGVALAIERAFSFIPDLGITHGDHFQNKGAAPMLDEHLLEQ